MRNTYFGFFDGLRGFGIYLTLTDAEGCSHAGDCDDDVSEVVKKPYVSKQLDRLGVEKIREGLKECGAWDAADLADDCQNRKRAVWLAACDIKENYPPSIRHAFNARQTHTG